MISIAFSSEVDAGSREGTSHQGDRQNYPIPRHRSKNERSGDAGLPRGHPNSANRVDLPAKGK
jgi:hypothetical protein